MQRITITVQEGIPPGIEIVVLDFDADIRAAIDDGIGERLLRAAQAE